LALAVARPEFVRGGKLIEGDFAGDRAGGDGAVVLQEGVAVGAVGEGDVENFGVIQRLLHTVAHRVVLSFASMTARGMLGL
jgi:hypothetical protein